MLWGVNRHYNDKVLETEASVFQFIMSIVFSSLMDPYLLKHMRRLQTAAQYLRRALTTLRTVMAEQVSMFIHGVKTSFISVLIEGASENCPHYALVASVIRKGQLPISHSLHKSV